MTSDILSCEGLFFCMTNVLIHFFVVIIVCEGRSILVSNLAEWRHTPESRRDQENCTIQLFYVRNICYCKNEEI